jgi:hypothetical protein
MSLLLSLQRKRGQLVHSLAEADRLIAGLARPDGGMCACSLAGAFDDVDSGHVARVQVDALPRGDDAWTVHTKLFWDGNETTFDEALSWLPSVTASNIREVICEGKAPVYSEDKFGRFPFFLLKATLRDVLRRTEGGKLTHESMYPLSVWQATYGFVGAVLQNDFKAYRAWWEHTAAHRPKAAGLSEIEFAHAQAVFEDFLGCQIVLRVNAASDASLRPTTPDGPGLSPWGSPSADFWEAEGSDGPFGWRILTAGKLRYERGSMSADLVADIVYESCPLASASP